VGGRATMGGVDASVRRTIDVLVGTSAVVVETANAARRRADPVLRPVGRLLLHPPVLPARLRPDTWLARLGERGAVERFALNQQLSRLLDVLVPAVVAEGLRRAGLTEKLIDYVDLDAVVAAVDLDAAAARLDVDAVVRRVDLDAAAAQLDVETVVRRVDLDSVAARLDVEAVVRRVDLDSVAARLDVDAVARRLDLDLVLDRLDLTEVVLTRVDLEKLVEAVLEQVDLPALAEQVVDAIDLPEIIRESSGSMASDTVQGARLQGIAADEAVGRAVDRLFPRRRPRE
jgi:hypothetical protein